MIKIWTKVAYPESVSDGIRLDSLNWNYEGVLSGISDSSKLSLSDNTMLGVADYSRLGEELGCNEGASLGVSEWGFEGIPEGNMLGTNVRNDK